MPDEFTAEEKAYVESRGEQGPAVEEATQEPVQTEQTVQKVQTDAPNAPPDAPNAPPVEERIPVVALHRSPYEKGIIIFE